MSRIAALALLALFAAPVDAASPGLTVKPGESWTFSLSGDRPVRAARSNPSAKPGPGRIHVTVRSFMGTTLAITSNSDIAYTYKAELIGAGKKIEARSCTLPAGGKLSLEHWPQEAQAVRLSGFRPAPEAGNCP